MLRNLAWLLAIGLAVLSGCGGSSSDRSQGGTSAESKGSGAGGLLAVAGAGSSASPISIVAAPAVVFKSGELLHVLKANKELSSSIDRTTFEVKARAAALGSESQSAFVFVRDSIATEPYPGVLRGAAGTLSAGSGNDVDKAVLLGALLEAQGHAYRYAYCQLDGDQARKLVRNYFAVRPARPFQEADLTSPLTRALEAEGLSKARSAELAAARTHSRDWLEAVVAQTANADLKLVRDTLTASGIKPEPADVTPTLVEEARQHYWLQVKAGDGWQDLDPVTPEMPAGRTLCQAARTFENLPTDVFQTITVTVRNEYLRNGTLTPATVLNQKLVVSDHYGDVIIFSNEVSGQAELLKTAPKRLTPTLTVGTTVARGEDYEYDAAAASSAGFDPFGSALSGGEEEPLKLVAQWLDFTIEAPGRKTLISRAVVDAVPPRERAQGKISTIPVPDLLLLSLVPAYAIAITAGPVQSGAALETAYGGLDIQAASRVYEGTKSSGKSTDEEVMAIATRMLRVYALQFALASERALAKSAATAGPHLRIVRDQPMITIAGYSLALSADGHAHLRASIDLRHDVARFAGDGPDSAEQAFWQNVRQGLIDGAIEHHLPMNGRTIDPVSAPRSYDTSTAIAAARAAGVELRASAGAEAVKVLHGDLAGAGGDKLAAEIGNGIAIVAPSRAPPGTGEARLGVWTIDLQSGHVNALLDNGLRAVMVDYTLRVKAMAILQVAIAACLRVAGRDCTGLIDQWTRIAQEFIVQLSEHGV